MKSFEKIILLLLTIVLCFGFIASKSWAEEGEENEVQEETETEILDDQQQTETENEHSELPEKAEVNWQQVLEDGCFDSEGSAILKNDAIVPENAIVIIHNGELIVDSGVTLNVKGMLLIDGGIVTVSENALLKNDFFVKVTETGNLCVEGNYEQSDYAGFVWESTGHSIVEGVEKHFIDKMVYVEGNDQIDEIDVDEDYRTVTITLSEASNIENLSESFLNEAIFSIQQGE